MHISIWNKHHGISPTKRSFYIGRGSPLGNPYVIGPLHTRDEAIDRYKIYLEERCAAKDPKILAELNNIYTHALEEPIALVCFCAPKRCHGEIIRQVLLDNNP